MFHRPLLFWISRAATLVAKNTPIWHFRLIDFTLMNTLIFVQETSSERSSAKWKPFSSGQNLSIFPYYRPFMRVFPVGSPNKGLAVQNLDGNTDIWWKIVCPVAMAMDRLSTSPIICVGNSWRNMSSRCVFVSGLDINPFSIRRQAITWTNADFLPIRHLGTNVRIKS